MCAHTLNISRLHDLVCVETDRTDVYRDAYVADSLLGAKTVIEPDLAPCSKSNYISCSSKLNLRVMTVD